MLKLTIPPNDTGIPIADGPSLPDVIARVKARMRAGSLAASTGESYIGALESAGARVNLPLEMIEATPERMEEIFPRNGFDPTQDSSNTAYELKRRRALAAVKEFSGLHRARKALRDQRDEWAELFDLLEPRTTVREGRCDWHPMSLEALRSFALVARAHGWQPRELDAVRAQTLDDAYSGNKRSANRVCLQRLDEIRKFPELLPLLPPVRIGFNATCRQEIKTGFPVHMERIFTPWIEAMTRSGWDPISRCYSDDHAKHRHVLRFALRCYLRIAIELGLLRPDASDLLPVLAGEEPQSRVAGEMFARQHRKKAQGHLSRRTSRKYLKGIKQVLQHLGLDTTILSQILANNKSARTAAKDDKKMTPKNRRFCEALVDKPRLRRRFLFAFRSLRAEAETLIAAAGAECRALTRREIALVRMLGTAACFAAIAIGGAPIRVRNAMSLTCVGSDAQIHIPKSKAPIKVRIPEEFTKNGVTIEFPIRHDKHGCHDTIRWYLRTIRPLYPLAATSRYLFPAIRKAGAHLDEGYFGERFSELMRRVVDLPMSPHQMRHGQTSLLLNAHPEEIEVIAKRIDDTVETLRLYYGYLDAMRLVERGQDLLVGLMNG